MFRRRLYTCFFWLTIGGALTLLAQNTASISETELAGVIRSVNTAQVTWKSRHGTYGGLRELAQDNLLATLKVPLKIDDGGTGMIDGYQVKVVVASDRRQYMASVTKENGCGTAMFSSESAVIYRARAFGCE